MHLFLSCDKLKFFFAISVSKNSVAIRFAIEVDELEFITIGK